MLVLFGYVAYELFLLIFTYCCSNGFYPGDTVVINNTSPMMMNTYGQPYGGNGVIVR